MKVSKTASLCDDIGYDTPFVQNLESKELNKKYKQALKSGDQKMINSCEEEINSRKIYELLEPIGDFISKIESNIIRGNGVNEDDKEMFEKLKHFYNPTRRHIFKHMLHYSKRLGEKQILEMVDSMPDLKEQESSIEEITTAIDILRNYQLNKENV